MEKIPEIKEGQEFAVDEKSEIEIKPYSLFEGKANGFSKHFAGLSSEAKYEPLLSRAHGVSLELPAFKSLNIHENPIFAKLGAVIKA